MNFPSPSSCAALASLTLSMAACAAGQTTDPPLTRTAEIERTVAAAGSDQMEAAMNRLAPPVLVTGEGRPGWSLEERLAHHNVPGVSIAVLEKGATLWSRGFGLSDASQGKPVEGATRFQAASVSKPVAAVAALRLVEEGLLDLDAPVNEHLKRWKVPANRFTKRDPVTLRHLLSHTAGLTVHGFPGYPANKDLPTSVQVLDGAKPSNTSAVFVDQRPGAAFRYSGGGYTVLQVLMEDVTGEAFPQLMKRLVLAPAGMSNSSFEQPLPELKAPHASAGHDDKGESLDGHSHRYPELAAAGLWTTAEDLLKLSIALSGGLEGGASLLGDEMMAELKTAPSGGSEYGLGFFVPRVGDHRVLHHSGANFGFRALWFFDEAGRYGAAIMTNGDNGQALFDEVSSALADVYGWSFGASKTRDAAHLSDAEKEAIPGHYVGLVDGAEHAVVVTAEKGHFVIESDLGIPPTAIFMTPDRSGFFSRSGGSIEAIYEDGKLTGMSLFGIKFTRSVSHIGESD